MIDLEAEGKRLDLGAINRLQHMKTGALIGYAAEAGAILGHGSPDTRHALKGYAQNLGLAFQITDDILDAEGDRGEVGKELGKDAEAGKATFYNILGPERATMRAQDAGRAAVQYLEIFGDYGSNCLRDVAPIRGGTSTLEGAQLRAATVWGSGMGDTAVG